MLIHPLNFKTIVLFFCPTFLQDHWSRIEASPLSFRLIRGTFWSLTGAVIARGFALLSSIIVAKLLGKEEFGELSIIQSTVWMFQVFAGLGLGLMATKYVAEFRTNDPHKSGRIIVLSNFMAAAAGALIAISFFILAPWLAKNPLAAPHLTDSLRIGAVMVFLGAMIGAQTGALCGLEAFKSISRVNLITGVLSCPMIVFGAYFGGIGGAIWGQATSMGLIWLMNQTVLKAEARQAGIPIVIEHCMKEWNALCNFSLPIILSSVAIASANWVSKTMLANQLNGYAGLGVFTAAEKWSQLTLFLPSSMSLAILSILSNLYGTQNIDAYRKIFKTNLLINLALVLTVSVPLIIFSRSAMRAYGKDYQNGWITLALLSATTIPVVSNTFFGQILVSIGLIWWRFALDIFFAILIIFCSWWLIPIYNENGLAVSNLIAFACVALILVFFVRHIFRKMNILSLF